MSKTKTIKINTITNDDIERIKIDNTKVIDVNDLKRDLNPNSIDDELNSMTREELEYRRDFEETDPEIINKINKILLKKSK